MDEFELLAELELLAGPNEARNFQPETGDLASEGVSHFVSPPSHHRYVYAVQGEILAVLVVRLDPDPVVEWVYTHDHHVRRGYATRMFRQAELDLGPIRHSSALSAKGAAWRASLRR